jgi:hypothetical protein
LELNSLEPEVQSFEKPVFSELHLRFYQIKKLVETEIRSWELNLELKLKVLFKTQIQTLLLSKGTGSKLYRRFRNCI